MSTAGDYIIYVDESGDHGTTNLDPGYPVFVLAFCVFRIDDYIHHAVPLLQRLKFRHFGHDMVILHERDIRQKAGDFAFLHDDDRQQAFMTDVTDLMTKAPFELVSVVIQKDRLKTPERESEHPYHIALELGLVRLEELLASKGQAERTTYVVAEERGKREDRELELEFRRICDEPLPGAAPLPFRIRFASKKAVSCGLQIADLVARPIGRFAMNPAQRNQAFEILKTKFSKCDDGAAMGWGLRGYPDPIDLNPSPGSLFDHA